MLSTPRPDPITLSGVTGTVPPNGPHNQPYEDPSGGWQQPPAYYTQPFNPPPQQQPRRGMSTGAIIGMVVAIVAVLCVGAAVAFTLVPTPKENPPAADGNAGTPAPYDTSQPTAGATSAAPAGPKTSFGDGTWEIGAAAGQVAPGKYKSTVPANSWGCYWERLSGTGGSFDEIITNGNAEKNTPVIVTIAAADKAFKSEDCGTWSPA